MNIVLIAIDTLRADHLSCYGYHRKTSPNLDRLARDGMIFKNCFTVTSHTMPSYTSLLTGLSPASHRIVGTLWCLPNENSHCLDDTIPTLAEELQDRGYLTCAVDNLMGMACHPSWFARGFEHYINFTRRVPAAREVTLGGHSLLQRASVCDVLAEEINERAIPWIRTYKRCKFFLFVHYWDPHQPYNVPEPYRTRYKDKRLGPGARYRTNSGDEHVRGWGLSSDVGNSEREKIDLYDAEIRYCDYHLGRVLSELRRQGLYEDSLVIVTSDHGETMAEHHEHFHHREVYDAVTHVPLVIKPPTGLLSAGAGPAVSEALVQNSDILPTILDLADGKEGSATCEPANEQLDGTSLLPVLHRTQHQHRTRVYSTGCFLKDGDYWKTVEACVRTLQWKLIHRADISPAIAHGVPQPFGHIGLLARAFRHPEVFEALPKWELHDLSKDPEEQHDVKEECAEVTAMLQNDLRPLTEADIFYGNGLACSR